MSMAHILITSGPTREYLDPVRYLSNASSGRMGAALADPSARVLCLIGDGGLMFAPGEVLSAVQEGLNITFLVFNNRGFGEIATAMREAGAEVLGCTPNPPELDAFARACGLPFARCTPDDLARDDLAGVINPERGPRLVEVVLDPVV